ncbi:cyclin-dependent kinase inhibitor 1B-like isoform X3 [Hyla sarda]|uniref:cyclin-dependent kinase inhibitor 1B-like isoform X3 n=1 Tax=Hyla sarda TaxID=327740 RepID=UPI0024C2130D|nr:cyclin-dependent kinase inhibitor 1B-like isoform X3 [Hyla sarda]
MNSSQEDSVPALLLPRMGMGAGGRGVCRSLFGPIDHDELRSELKRQLKEIQASDCQRWNFDFESGTPLKGTFCWEPLESKEMPGLYRESRLCPASATPVSRQTSPRLPVPPADTREESPAETVQQNKECAKENADKAVKKCQGVKGPSKTSAHSTPSLLRKRETSTSITDYFPKRKRTQAPKTDNLKVAHHPLCTLEQTPRKKIR